MIANDGLRPVLVNSRCSRMATLRTKRQSVYVTTNKRPAEAIMAPRLKCIAFLGLGLSACLPGEAISVRVLHGGSVEFSSVPDAGSTTSKCIGSVELFEVTTSGEALGARLWGVLSNGSCVDHVTYPEVPVGFRVLQQGHLREGQRYAVVAQVNQGIASKRFTYSR